MRSPSDQVQTLQKEVEEMKAAFRAELDELRSAVSELKSQVSGLPVAPAQGQAQPAIMQPAVQANSDVGQQSVLDSQISDSGEKLDSDDSSSSGPVLKKREQKAARKEKKSPLALDYEVQAFMEKYEKK